MNGVDAPYVVIFSNMEHFMPIMKEQYCRSLIPHTTTYDDTVCEHHINAALNGIFLRPRDIHFRPTRRGWLRAGLKRGKLRHGFSLALGDSVRFTYPQDTDVLILNDRYAIIQINELGEPVIYRGPETAAHSNRRRSTRRSSGTHRRRTTRRHH